LSYTRLSDTSSVLRHHLSATASYHSQCRKLAPTVSGEFAAFVLQDERREKMRHSLTSEIVEIGTPALRLDVPVLSPTGSKLPLPRL
jgi:hypothetical protein